jgi:glycosyltransferase involved in cell wall biosynthesis
MTQKRIAIVVQRYGAEVNGGAEDAARAVAEHLTALGEVHVMTTCALDYTSWATHYPPGTSKLNEVTVHRFPVDKVRNWRQSSKRTGRFLLNERTLEAEIEWVRQEGPFSTPLLQFIKQSEAEFDVFIFFTYVYATTFFSLPLVAHKAILVPTAHDEPFLYMPVYRALFQLPQAFIYLTQAEQDLVLRVAGNGRIPHTIAAIGLTPPQEVSAQRFRQKYHIEGDFLLYGGRISDAKNVPELFDFFLRYRKQVERPLKLVLMGKPHIPLPDHPDIISVGFVSEQDKYDALKAAAIVVQPSRFESLSIIILEAWLMGTPVLVNGRCAVTKQQCRRSNGGLYYTTYNEFAAELSLLLNAPKLRQQLGRQGRQFTAQHYNWETIIAQYQSMFNKIWTKKHAN